MPNPDRTPARELMRYVGIAAAMSAAMLILSRGKWLFALLLGIWLFFAVKRLMRALQKAPLILRRIQFHLNKFAFMTERLLEIRKEIDDLDDRLVALLAERFALTTEVGLIKKQEQLPPIDATREAAQMQRIATLAGQHGLDAEVVQRILRAIINEVVVLHQKI